MARIKLDLDQETYEHLLNVALAERRPVHWQAEIMLRQALGLPFPYRDTDTGRDIVVGTKQEQKEGSTSKEEGSSHASTTC